MVRIQGGSQMEKKGNIFKKRKMGRRKMDKKGD
jgi:hypothetical protein